MEKRQESPAISADLELNLGIPILARQARAWQDITVEWEKIGAFELEPHGYPEHRLSLILNRCPRLVRKEERAVHDLSVENGDLFIAPAGQAIGYRWNTQLEMVSLLFKPSFLDGIAARTMDLNGNQVELIGRVKWRDPLISAIVLTLRKELEHESTGSRLLVDSLTQALGVHLLRAHTAFPTRAPEIKGGLPRWRLQRVLGFIEEHLKDDVSLSELSEAAGNLSRYHFARLFKQSTGYSPYQYFTLRRIRRAQSMLRNQKLLSLGEIAFACGFRDQSAFSRVFRQITGSTPKAFRDT